MSLHELELRYSRLDNLMLKFMARYGLTCLRVSVGVVFFWFGALKLFPGVSPAEHLIRESITFLPFLACWEMAIGLGFITGKLPRVTMALMMAQMMGAMSPLVLRPDLIWAHFPVTWTLEGQYVFKDIILISAGMVISAARISRMHVTDVAPEEREYRRINLDLKRATQQ